MIKNKTKIATMKNLSIASIMLRILSHLLVLHHPKWCAAQLQFSTKCFGIALSRKIIIVWMKWTQRKIPIYLWAWQSLKVPTHSTLHTPHNNNDNWQPGTSSCASLAPHLHLINCIWCGDEIVEERQQKTKKKMESMINAGGDSYSVFVCVHSSSTFRHLHPFNLPLHQAHADSTYNVYILPHSSTSTLKMHTFTFCITITHTMTFGSNCHTLEFETVYEIKMKCWRRWFVRVGGFVCVLLQRAGIDRWTENEGDE